MKLMHLADLHIGKRVNEISMLEEQRHALGQILAAVRQERPEAALLCGDIYDKPQPPAEAVQLCDWFLSSLAAEPGLKILLIPGNHDSAERLAFAASLLAGQGVYIARPFAGEAARVELADGFGPVDFYLLPFLKPAAVRRALSSEAAQGREINLPDYNAAVAYVLEGVRERLRPRPVRNILLGHQLITGGAVCDSEELAVGGLDNVDARLFDGFDYVALGHLHSPQQVQAQKPGEGMPERRPLIRYAGSPLKYSFSEVRQRKSLTVLEIDGEGRVETRLLPLTPLHDMRELKGDFARLTSPEFCRSLGAGAQDYLHITLTDEADVVDGALRLRQLYPNLMKLDYDNRRTRASRRLTLAADAAGGLLERGPLALFADFYEQQNNQRLGPEQEELLRKLIEEIWEGEAER